MDSLNSFQAAYRLAKNYDSIGTCTPNHLNRLIGKHLKTFYRSALGQDDQGLLNTEILRQMVISNVTHSEISSGGYLSQLIQFITGKSSSNKKLKLIINKIINNDPKLNNLVNQYRNRLNTLY